MSRKILFLVFFFLLIISQSSLAVSFPRQEITEILTTSWQHYQDTLIAQDGRPLCNRDDEDLDNDGDRDEFLTFSEGAGYALLRAVYVNDRATFDKVWNWTYKNLWRRQLAEVYYWGADQGRDNYWSSVPGERKDNLFAWRYCGSIDNSSKGGVIYYTFSGSGYLWRDGLDAAADADQDIAAALLLAHKSWGSEEKNEQKNYLNCARLILNDIWNKEVKNIGGRFYLLGGDKYSQVNGINPSYFRMAYYSGIFSEADPAHPWVNLVESSYQVLLKCREAVFTDEKGEVIKSRVNLPPNWLALDENGRVTDNPWNTNGYLFGWDAFRVLYQVALHYKTTADPYAASYLKDCLSPGFDFGPNYFLKQELTDSGRICGGYRLDGGLTYKEGLGRQLAGQNGAYLAYFYAAGDNEAATQIYESLKQSYRSAGYWGFNPTEYYQQNWVWFGLELTSGQSLALYGTGPEVQLALK